MKGGWSGGGGGAAGRPGTRRAGPAPDFEPAGELVRRLLGRGGAPAQRRVAQIWAEAVGEENARNARPRSLRGGRLVVTTSSPIWAHALQMMAAEIVARLNRLLGEELVREAVFRTAGWEALDDGGVGKGGSAAAAPGPPGTARRRLTEEEEAAVAAVRAQACDETLGERIAAAMRAALETRPR
ncbi:MAG: DUF721 domain-containing protein [Actinobacteria bacterium]|nr:DUF721 domain-containing protein [Actinomycetota bacterium]